MNPPRILIIVAGVRLGSVGSLVAAAEWERLLSRIGRVRLEVRHG